MNIFYTQVDTNLQKELNARAQSAFIRDTGSLNFMLGKIANVELSAYEGPGPAVDDSKRIHVLGGNRIWARDYLAYGEDGFLNPTKTVERPGDELDWNWNPSTKSATPTKGIIDAPNPQKRIPPYISSADIQIGDNSMGLLNTANVVIEIPNAERDLNLMEELYMRPGRYVKLIFIHDPKTLVSVAETQGLLSGSIPSDSKLKELYPGVDLDFKKTEIRRMNQVVFEGLLTNFDFSYQKDFSVQLQIQLRGTSNVFTDVSMFIDAQGNSPGTATANPIADPAKYNTTINFEEQVNTNATGSGTPRVSFYQQLFAQVEQDYNISFENKNETPIIDISTSHGASNIIKKQLNRLDKPANTIHTDQYFLCGNAWDQSYTLNNKSTNEVATFQRYITLGYLINFINNTVLREVLAGKNTGKIVSNAQIICSDKFCYSNYYPELCSIDPQNILLLPADNKRGTTEAYGVTMVNVPTQKIPVFNKKIFFKDTLSVDNTWEGFTGKLQEKTNRAYPSRIMINLDLIKDILQSLSAGNTTAFKVSDFLAAISLQILNATSGAISLKLITHPEDQTVLAFYDEKFIGTPEDKRGVKEYTIPMTTTGTVVHDFQLKASLPENVSSLSYVLNQDPTNITTEDIGPYINYMYNSNDPTKVTQAQQTHANKHLEFKNALTLAKSKFAASMIDENLQAALDLAQKNYLTTPTPNLKDDIQRIAPIIPFDITFTIDGIHGFRYGDVLTFDVLPDKYKINTVFSIVGVNHQVSQDSTWTTEIRCIMRPKVNG
jgi:hypothetical protein